MNIVRRIVIAAAVMAGCTSVANAQYFDKLGAGVGVGTNGISIDVATRITDFVQMRAGVDIMPGFTFNADADVTVNDPTGAYGSYDTSMNLKGDLGRTQGHVIFNVYPAPKIMSLYVAAGAYFGGNKLVKVTGHNDELADLAKQGDVIIGDFKVPIDPTTGDVKGGLKVNGFRPYLGIGWGKAIPGKLLNFNTELGVQFEGKPKVYSDYGEVDTSIIEDNNTFNKIRKALSVYPVLTFKLNFRVI